MKSRPRADYRAATRHLRHAVVAALMFVTALAQAAPSADEFLRAVRLADATNVAAYIAANGNLGITDRSGRPPLHVAVRHGHLEITEQLIAAEANVNERDADGWTALHFAAESGDLDAISLLLAAGANVNASDPYRYMPLHLAAREGHDAACEKLISAGADVRAAIDVGFTAADLAEAFPELRDWLLARESP